jgi:PAS domain S-box-containing protein
MRPRNHAVAETRAANLLKAIVDSSDDAIISKDLNGVITSWNQSAERLFGYTAEEAIGKTIAELLIPNDRQDEEPNILARLRNGERVDHFETVRRRKDGTLLDISLTISPVKDAGENIVGASKIARDITDAKRFRMIPIEAKLDSGSSRTQCHRWSGRPGPTDTSTTTINAGMSSVGSAPIIPLNHTGLGSFTRKIRRTPCNASALPSNPASPRTWSVDSGTACCAVALVHYLGASRPERRVSDHKVVRYLY